MKYPIMIVFLCSVSTAVLSQNIVLKPTIGINISDFSKTPPEGKVSGQLGWQVGGSIVFGKKFYLEPGLFYAQKSSKYSVVDNSNPSNDINQTFDITGIRIPVSIGYNLIGNSAGAFNIRAFGGGSAFIVTNVSGGDKSAYSSPTWGVFAGAGVDFLIFFVDLKYEWSLTNIQKDISQIDLGKSRSFFANAGVKLPL
jgi:Outer membrane protein beta-barrel domain